MTDSEIIVLSKTTVMNKACMNTDTPPDHVSYDSSVIVLMNT
ncbi:MAG: hypothetical protein WA114_09805 [Psychrobacter glacincola]